MKKSIYMKKRYMLHKQKIILKKKKLIFIKNESYEFHK